MPVQDPPTGGGLPGENTTSSVGICPREQVFDIFQMELTHLI